MNEIYSILEKTLVLMQLFIENGKSDLLKLSIIDKNEKKDNVLKKISEIFEEDYYTVLTTIIWIL